MKVKTTHPTKCTSSVSLSTTAAGVVAMWTALCNLTHVIVGGVDSVYSRAHKRQNYE